MLAVPNAAAFLFSTKPTTAKHSFQTTQIGILTPTHLSSILSSAYSNLSVLRILIRKNIYTNEYASMTMCMYSYSRAWTRTHAVHTNQYEYSWEHTHKFALSCDPSLMLLLSPGSHFLSHQFLPNARLYPGLVINHRTRVRVQMNTSDYADLCTGISFTKWQTQTADWLVSDKKKIGVGEVYEFNNSKYRCDVPTPLRPELKIKCAFIIWKALPACFAQWSNEVTRQPRMWRRGAFFSRYQTRTAALPHTQRLQQKNLDSRKMYGVPLTQDRFL